MKRATYTPDTWVAENMKVTSGSMFIADCDGLGDLNRQAISRANAGLIAAAPDLLRVLKKITTRATCSANDSCGQPMVSIRAALLDEAQAAIRKATG